jgi:hypothetical protein
MENLSKSDINKLRQYLINVNLMEVMHNNVSDDIFDVMISKLMLLSDADIIDEINLKLSETQILKILT